MCSIQTFVLCDLADGILACSILLFLVFVLFLSLGCIGLRRSVRLLYLQSNAHITS